MKKKFSILIVLSIILGSCLINVSALDTETSDVKTQVMVEVEEAFDNLANKYGSSNLQIFDYYCHFADASTIDYVYVQWSSSGGSDAIRADRYFDFLIISPQILSPTIGLYIYDVENKKIYTFKEAETYATDYLRDFLDNHRNEIYPYYDVYKCGDVDLDGELTVLDATKIQRALVGIDKFPNIDGVRGYEKVFYLSDYDYDDSRSVKDSTAIQMKLAKVSDEAKI